MKLLMLTTGDTFRMADVEFTVLAPPVIHGDYLVVKVESAMGDVLVSPWNAEVEVVPQAV